MLIPRCCPQCNSMRLFKNGWRKLRTGEKVQTYICRECGYRFTEPLPLQVSPERRFLRPGGIFVGNQICAQGAKNLVPHTEIKTVASDGVRRLNDDIEGLVAQYLAYLEREGFAEESKFPYLIRRLTKLGANLSTPESVKQIIGKMKVKNGSKIQYVYAYDNFAKMLKINWSRPQ